MTAVAALGLLGAGCTDSGKPEASSSSASPPALETYSLGETAMTALTGGTLQLEPRSGVLCSFVGGDRVVWPDGYRVSADGSSIQDQTGRTTAYSGKRVALGGGLDARQTSSPCLSPTGNTWFASSVTERELP